MIDRLSIRGIDVLEWACVVESSCAGWLAWIRPQCGPVVYVTLAPNTAAASGPAGEKTGVDARRNWAKRSSSC